MIRICVFIFLHTISFESFTQGISTRTFDSLSIVKQHKELHELFGFNKLLIKELEYSSLIALSFFNELDSTRIEFRKKSIKTTLNVRPTVSSLFFRKKAKRKYIIRINDNVNTPDITVDEVPFNAQIGLLGHEFCHIVDYQSRNFFQVIGRLFSYTSKKSKERFEKEIDQLTISKGLGWQLYDWSYYVLHTSDATNEYKNFKKQIYLEPDEIISIIEFSH